MRIWIALGISVPTIVERVSTVDICWVGAQLAPAATLLTVLVRTRPSSL